MAGSYSRRYVCNACGATRSKRSLISSHMQMCQPQNPSFFSVTGRDNRRYVCEICGCSRSKVSLYRKHLQTHSSAECNAECETDWETSATQSDDSASISQTSGDTSSAQSDTSASITETSGATSSAQSDTSASTTQTDVEGSTIQTNVFSSPSRISKETSTAQSEEMKKRKRVHECRVCGFEAKKPAHLQQHMLNHSDERLYICPKEGCGKSYKRQYHLDRHMHSHDKVGHLCPKAGCIMICSSKSNLQRHLKKHELKDELQRGRLEKIKKSLKCPHPDCPKTFRYPFMVQRHYDLKHGFQYADIVCFVEGCGKRFPDAAALHDHSRTAHSKRVCYICGSTVSSRSFKQHLMTHDDDRVRKSLFCPYDGCTHSYVKSSNLKIHIKICHMGVKEYRCTVDGCGKTFAYRRSRDNHEKSGSHVHSEGDFVERDEKFCSQPRGGRKPATIHKIEDLYEKRVRRP